MATGKKLISHLIFKEPLLSKEEAELYRFIVKISHVFDVLYLPIPSICSLKVIQILSEIYKAALTSYMTSSTICEGD